MFMNAKRACSGPARLSAAPMVRKIILRRMIAGKHEMIAVVDEMIEHGIEIGTAAPARLSCAFNEADLRALLGERDCGGEPRQSGADP